MAFKPMNQSNGGNFDGEQRNYPTPKEGSRKARVSLIVDLGIQNREPIFKDSKGEMVTEDTPGATEHPQKPSQQVAVFADLTADIVDYGGSVGKAQYRMLLNKAYKGVVQGINFSAVPPTDAKGKRIEGKPWGLHPNNVLTKLAKAMGKEEVITSLDIDELLNGAFMADIEVKKAPDKNGKKDKDDKVIIYTNVNYKGAAKVPNQEDDDGNDIGPMKVPALLTPAMSIQFDSATKDQIQFLRSNLRKQIKLANNYAGSAMQKAIEAFEADQADKADQDGSDAAADDATPEAKPEVKAKKTNPKPVPKEDQGSDSPF